MTTQNESHQRLIREPSGIDLPVETFGDPSSSLAILFVPGGGQSLRCFKNQYEEFSKHFYVLGMDLPCQGDTPPLAQGTHLTGATFASCIQAVIAACGLLERPLIIVAWSFGSQVVRNYLALFPHDQVIALVLFASPFDTEKYLKHIHASTSHWSAFQVVSTVLNPDADLAKRLDALERAVLQLASRLSDDDRYEVLGYNFQMLRQLQAFGGNPWADVTLVPDAQPKISCPILLIQGIEDQLVPPSYAQQIAQELPSARLLLLPCGHSAMLEMPNEVNQAMSQFFAQEATL